MGAVVVGTGFGVLTHLRAMRAAKRDGRRGGANTLQKEARQLRKAKAATSSENDEQARESTVCRSGRGKLAGAN